MKRFLRSYLAIQSPGCSCNSTFQLRPDKEVHAALALLLMWPMLFVATLPPYAPHVVVNMRAEETATQSKVGARNEMVTLDSPFMPDLGRAILAPSQTGRGRSLFELDLPRLRHPLAKAQLQPNNE